MTKRLAMLLVWFIAVVVIAGFPAHMIAQTVASQANPGAVGLFGEGIWSAIMAAMMPGIFEWLKKQPWFPLLARGEWAMNRAVAIVTAILTAMSIHWSFSHGDTGWQLVLGGPHQSVIGFIAQALAQYFGQQYAYWIMKAAGAAEAVANALGKGGRS